MTDVLRIGDPAISVALRRRKNARRLTLRMALSGPVLTVPSRMPAAQALDFLVRQEGWLRKRLNEQPERIQVSSAASVPVEGIHRTIGTATGRVCSLTPEAVLVPGPEHLRAAKLKAFLRTMARDRLTEAADRFSARLGRPYTKITLRDTRSRWGSCTSAGGLMFSWRLIMAPSDVLTYVAAHEVAHLEHMNHAPEFWAVVEALYPDHGHLRQWLRDNGAALHHIDFDA